MKIFELVNKGVGNYGLGEIALVETDLLLIERDPIPAGGTAGQVLKKIDATDYNTQWAADLAGSSEILGGFFRFNVATTDTDPTAGKIAFNNATAASVTFLYIDSLNDGGVDVSNYTKSLKIGDIIFIQNKDSAANWARFKVTANAADGTGYYKVAVAYVDGNAAIPTTNQNLLVVYNMQDASAFVELTEATGAAIAFDKDYIHGNAAAITGNITYSFTNEKRGAVVCMIHNQGTVPTFPAETKIIAGSYTISVDNYIWFCLTKTASVRVVQVTIGKV